eukprot:Hpha_TRINITY_DN740_c1_g1::TRINITY_DN740_c1_g1_i1::g.28877::m.28877
MPRGRLCRLWSEAHICWKILLLHACCHQIACIYAFWFYSEPLAKCSGSKLMVTEATIDPAEWGYPASNCIDGVTGGKTGLCHSALPGGTNPTLKLELESLSLVTCVEVYNSDPFGCCSERLGSHHMIKVSHGETSVSQVCVDAKLNTEGIGLLTYNTPSCADIPADSVSLYLPGKNRVLNLAEVVVYGTVIVDSPVPQPQSGTKTGGRGHEGSVVVGATPAESTADGEQAPEDYMPTTTREESDFDRCYENVFFAQAIWVHSLAQLIIALAAIHHGGIQAFIDGRIKATVSKIKPARLADFSLGVLAFISFILFFVTVCAAWLLTLPTALYVGVCVSSLPNIRFGPFYTALVELVLFAATICGLVIFGRPGTWLYCHGETLPEPDPNAKWRPVAGGSAIVMCLEGHPLESANSGDPCSRLERNC